MWSDGNGVRTLKGSSGMTRVEIASAVEQIVAAVADEHGLVEARDGVTLDSRLDDDLGMDEVDLIEVLFRAEERFCLVLPDDGIGPSSTVDDIDSSERGSEKHRWRGRRPSTRRGKTYRSRKRPKAPWSGRNRAPLLKKCQSCSNAKERAVSKLRDITSPARTSESGR